MDKSVFRLKDLLSVLAFFLLNFSILCGGNFRAIGPLTLRHVCMLVLFAVAFFHLREIRIRRDAISLYLLYILVLCFFNVVNQEFTTEYFLRSLYTYHGPCVAIALGLPFLLKDRRRLNCFTYSLILLYLIDVVLTIMQFNNSSIAWRIATFISESAEEGMGAAEMYSDYTSSLLGYSLTAGIFGFVVTNGYYLACCLPVLTYRIFHKNRLDALWAVLMLIVGGVAIFITQQRMAFLCFLLYSLFFIFFGFKKKYGIAVFFLLLFLGLYVVDINTIDFGRLTSDVNNDTRFALFEGFFEFIKTRAFWYGGAVAFLEKYQEAQHNTFLSAWVQGGVFTFLLFVVLYFKLLMQSIGKVRRNLRNTQAFPLTIAYALASILFLIYSLTHSAGVQNGSPMFWFFYMAMLAAQPIESE